MWKADYKFIGGFLTLWGSAPQLLYCWRISCICPSVSAVAPLRPDGIQTHSVSGHDIFGAILVSGTVPGILGNGLLGALEQVCNLDREWQYCYNLLLVFWLVQAKTGVTIFSMIISFWVEAPRQAFPESRNYPFAIAQTRQWACWILPRSQLKVYTLGSLIFTAYCRVRHTVTNSTRRAEPGEHFWTREVPLAGWQAVTF